MPFLTYKESEVDGENVLTISLHGFAGDIIEKLKFDMNAMKEETDIVSTFSGLFDQGDGEYTKESILNHMKKYRDTNTLNLSKTDAHSSHKIDLIKTVRMMEKERTGEHMGLREAKELVEYLFTDL